jgi:hypothetical protein
MSGLLAWHVSDVMDNDAPLTEKEVRSTVEPVRNDGEKAEATHAPEWNELDTDESSELVGLSPRVVGSDTVDSKEYPPWWVAGASDMHNVLIDSQVASSGTAAAREVAGQQGHGTMQYEIGIEPVIRAGAAFGNDYFLSHAAEIQEGAGNYMNALNDDNFANAIAQSNANRNSRQAFNDSLFADFLG